MLTFIIRVLFSLNAADYIKELKHKQFCCSWCCHCCIFITCFAFHVALPEQWTEGGVHASHKAEDQNRRQNTQQSWESKCELITHSQICKSKKLNYVRLSEISTKRRIC